MHCSQSGQEPSFEGRFRSYNYINNSIRSNDLKKGALFVGWLPNAKINATATVIFSTLSWFAIVATASRILGVDHKTSLNNGSIAFGAACAVFALVVACSLIARKAAGQNHNKFKDSLLDGAQQLGNLNPVTHVVDALLSPVSAYKDGSNKTY
jgi:hypothetical protein